MYLRAPRNYAFLNRLPRKFQMKVEYKQNEVSSNKIWYFVEINEQKLYILSTFLLDEGKIYTVEKITPLKMRILKS